MFKWILIIRKKTGMNREEFIEYYEHRHVPLVRKLLPPMPTYRRNYVANDPMQALADRGSGTVEASFDVMTECIFDTREQAEAFMAAFADPDISREILQDEANFIEPGHVRMYIVEVRQTVVP
jgi:uncharacterized protein (TIGR02118 family)